MLDHIKQARNPFNLYDFFGYLFPAVIFMSYLFSIIYHYYFEESQSILEKLHSFATDSNFFVLFIITSVCLIFLYVIGHIIATIGSLILDRIYMKGIFCFPQSYLLKMGWNKELKLSFYFKTVFFLLNVFITSQLIYYIFELCFKLHTYEFFKYLKIFVLFLLFTVLFWALVIEKPLCRFFSKEYSPIIKGKILKKINNLYNFFIDKISVLVNNNKALPDSIIKKIESEYRKKFQLEMEDSKTELYYLPYYYVSNNFPSFDARLNNWHYLYAFSRNIFSASFIFCFGCVLKSLFSQSEDIYTAIIFVASFVIGVIFYLRYLNLFQDYYIRNIFRTFIAATTIEKELNKDK